MSDQPNTQTPATEARRKPVTPGDLIKAKVGCKNTIYAGVASGEIETFRLGGKIIITPGWVRKFLGW